MNIRYFTHSLESCWNHGNAHFLRGVMRELGRRGHEAVACEPADSWSRENLLADHGARGLEHFRAAYPDLMTRRYEPDGGVERLIDGADLVIVHEWNQPGLVAELGRLRARGGRFTLLFHDTHHRAVSAPEEMERFDLTAYDGVLAFGEALSEVYRRRGWGARVWTWHEAADLSHFRPPQEEVDRAGLVWIGNWGDGERTAELEQFLFRPASAAGLPLDIYGVRYPDEARAMLASHGARYHGWTPNASVPALFARHLATAHVPRRYYASALPGIPTIRMFEALACGIPLVSAPWEDCEQLFRTGQDYLRARDGAEMTRHLRVIAADPHLRAELAANGLETVRSRHGCSHRVDELMGILQALDAPIPATRTA